MTPEEQKELRDWVATVFKETFLIKARELAQYKGISVRAAEHQLLIAVRRYLRPN